MKQKESEKYYEIGLNFVKEKNFCEAEPYFKKCLELDPKNANAYYQLLMNAAALGNHETYLEICNKLKEFDDPRVVSNANYYLYFLQFLGGPRYAADISLNDMLLGEDEEERNYIRERVYLKNFKGAGNILHNRFIAGSKDNKVETLLESKLISLAKKDYHKNKEKYLDLIAVKNYHKILSLITRREKLHMATRTELYFKKLCQFYILLSKGEEIEVYDQPEKDLFKLINSGNFDEALEQSKLFNERHDQKDDDNPFTPMLKDICYLRDRLENQKRVNAELKKSGKYRQDISNFYKNLISLRGARILGEMSQESDVEQLFAYNTEKNQVKAVRIKDENNNDRVAIINKEYDPDYEINLEMANDFFKKEKYRLAIREYTRVIETTDDYPDYIYERLAIAFYNIKDISRALIYTRLAFNVEKDKEKRDSLILLAKKLKSVKDRTNKGETTPEKEVKEEIEIVPISDVNDFNSINNYIIKNDLDVTTAGQQLGLSESEINMIKLIYAEELYRAHYEMGGDKFIESVEQSPSKTENVIGRLKRVKEMKRVYLNKSISNQYNIPFNIKPEIKGRSY